MLGYCLKCKQKREMTDTQETRFKNGRPATRGKCVVCGTAVFVLGKANQTVRRERPEEML